MALGINLKMLSLNLVFQKRATILLVIFLATDWMAAARLKLVLDMSTRHHLSQELRHSGVRHDHENCGRVVVVRRDVSLLG